MTDRASEAAFDVAAAADWTPFEVSFTTWGSMDANRCWRWAQISRKGENLVLQLNFPDRFTADFEYWGGKQLRRRLDSAFHPVRLDHRMTLAWVRLDFDPWGEDVLIEEIQSDWIRFLHDLREQAKPSSANFEFNRVVRQGIAAYGPIWARAAMLAALAISVREFGMRRIWMHQPDTGAKLKAIDVVLPPRSVYTDLPKRFGFQPTQRAPEFLYRARSKALARLRRSGKPLFWLLDLDGGSSVQDALRNRAA